MKVKLHYVQPRANFAPACEWLGTITLNTGVSGTLMRGLTGEYFMVKYGNTMPLDRASVEAAIASAGTIKPGRPSLYGSPLRRTEVFLSDAHVATAQALGNGNVSAGIRALLDACASTDTPKT